MRPSSLRSAIARRLAIAVSATLALVGVAGCTGAQGPPRGYLQADLETSPTSLDPRYGTDAISERLNELLFDSMVKLDPRGQFAPDLAEDIQRPSATELLFHLRREIRFSDGRPFTARDVKYSYDSVLDPRSGSPKRAGLVQIKSIEALDDYTIRMTTYAPYAPALEMATLDIVPAGTPWRGAATPDAPAGTGPFRLAKFERDDRVVFDRNPYRGAHPGSIAGIVFKIVPDPTVRALELAEGVCTLAENNLEPDLLGYLRAQPNLRVIESPGTAYQYLTFNFRDPRLRDLRVRRAIAYAIDRRAIVDSLRRRTARVATGMLTPENWAYESGVMTYPYDPERARRLLEEAGYPADRAGMRDLALVYKTTPEGVRLAEVVQAMLKRVGIAVKVRTNEWATFYGDMQRGNFEIASMQWVGIRDPHHYYMVFDSRMTPPSGLNRGAYSNPAMDALVEAGDLALDQPARRKIYAQVQKLAAEDLPYLSLWWQDNVVVISAAAAGFVPFPNGSLISLSDVTFAPAAQAEPR